MPLIRAEAFVLRSQMLGEADKIVTLLTREDGKIRALAKSARKSRRRFGSALEPWSRVSVALFERESSELARLDACDLLESAYRLQEDFDTACLLAYLSEVTDLFSRDRQSEPHYFRLLGSLVGALREGLSRPLARRYFEVWTLKLHGLLPDLARCDDCSAPLGAAGAVVDVVSGTARCARCGRQGPHAAVLREAGWSVLERILHAHPSSLVGRKVRAVGLEEVGTLASAALGAFAQTRFRTERFLAPIQEVAT